MLSKILGTILTRILVAAITLAIVLINSRFLGAGKVGTISLIVLAITLIQLVNGFVGGGAIVYLAPRASLITLFLPSVIWSIITSALGSWILDLFGMIPEGFAVHVLLLSLILSLATSCNMILMGQERIRLFNLAALLQSAGLIVALLFWLFILGIREVQSYVTALYVSYLTGLTVSLGMIVARGGWGKLNGMRKVIGEIFHFGSVMQTGNLLQFFNYRLSYYFTEFFSGRSALGVFSVGVQLSESVWLIGRSIHMVQYSRISNEKDPDYAARITLILTKISFLITLVCLAFLLIAVWLLFPLLFTEEFAGVKWVMAALSSGILVFSVSITLSPYFSGLGKPVHNTVSALTGLVFTVVSGLILIPPYGFTGAAISASLSYTAATLYQFIVFTRQTAIKPAEFLPSRRDMETFHLLIREYLKKDAPSPVDKIMKTP